VYEQELSQAVVLFPAVPKLTSIPGSSDTLRARTTSRKFVLQFVISQISTQQPSLTILYLILYDPIYMQRDCSRGSS